MLGVIKYASHESTSGGRGRVCIYGFESDARVASGRLSWQVDIDALEARCADLEGEESGANADDALDDALRPAHSGADSPPQDGASVATEEEPAAPVDFEWLDDLLCPSDVDGPRDVELFPEEELSGDALVAPPLAAPATPPSATGSSGVAHGAASSSGDVAPPPMAPPAPVGSRGKAAYVLFVPWGETELLRRLATELRGRVQQRGAWQVHHDEEDEATREEIGAAPPPRFLGRVVGERDRIAQ